MSSNMFHIPAGHASESQDEDGGVLGGRATIGDEGPTEESNVHARDRDRRAGQVDGRTEEHRRAGRTGEGDETMELQLRAEGNGREKEYKPGDSDGEDDGGWAAANDLFWKREVNSEAGEGKVEDGAVLFMIDGEWRQVPRHLWAWKSLVQQRIYRKCNNSTCNSPFNCSGRVHGRLKFLRVYDHWVWIPKLISTPAHIRDSPSLRSMSPRSPSSHPSERRDAATLGARIPPELFPLRYGWLDEELARKCRSVCRHWDEKCRQRGFTRLYLKSEKQVLNLVRFKHDPAWRHIPPFVEGIHEMPPYNDKSTQPWLHLLDPRWPGEHGDVELCGPFPGRRTIRSIHFALSRSLPQSFSQGIRWLRLTQVNFRHFEDTTCVVSELPDLEVLCLDKVTWQSLPTQLPRRRPRVNRGKLAMVLLTNCNVVGNKSPSFLFPAFTLYPNVYSASSFFSADIVTTAEAVLHLVSSRSGDSHVRYNPEDKTDDILDYFYFGTYYSTAMEAMLAFSSPRDDSTGDDSISVFINFDHVHVRVIDDDSDDWAKLNTAIGALQRRTRFLFGFDDRARMLHFAAHVVNAKLSSLSMRGKVQYTVAMIEKREFAMDTYWYQASLESEELQGEGMRDPLKVYSWGRDRTP